VISACVLFPKVPRPPNSETGAMEKKLSDLKRVTFELADLYAQERYPEALDLGVGALKTFPNSYEVLEAVGNCYCKMGNHGLALTHLGAAIEERPNHPPAHFNLGVAHAATQNLDKAKLLYESAIELKPDYALAHFNLGVVLHQNGDGARASRSYRSAIKYQPVFPDAYNNLGALLESQGLYEDALEAFQTACSLSPENPQYHYNKGLSLHKLKRFREAVKAYNTAVHFNPDAPSIHANLGASKRQLGDAEGALACFDRVLKFNRSSPEAHHNRAMALADLGRVQESTDALHSALAARPDYPDALRLLADFDVSQVDARLKARIEALWGCDEQKDRDWAKLGFALYKICIHQNDFDAAFKHLCQARLALKDINPYDRSADSELFQNLKASTDAWLSLTLEKNTVMTSTPVFIVGLPRSGSTLVEQIISGHTDVQGLGELPFFPEALAEQVKTRRSPGKKLRLMRQRYIDRVAGLYKPGRYFTDKLPSNFRFLPILASAFPEAKFVHVYRDPSANCWSNFETFFSEESEGLAYCHDLEDIIFYQNLYQDLMSFYQERIGHRIYHLEYGRLVENWLDEIMHLADYLGLIFQDAMLNPHANSRGVTTASHMQVRKKVYGGADDKWRKFSANLNGRLDNLAGFRS